MENLKKEPTIKINKFTPKDTLQYGIGGLLYTPATNTQIGNKIKSEIYVGGNFEYLKSIALCLEDAIGDGQVFEAEKCVVNTLQLLKTEIVDYGKDLPLIFIRVREPKQIWRLYRKCGSLLELITGFLIPKFNKDNMQDYIENFHKVKEHITSPLYILPIIESTDAICIQNRVSNLIKIKECLDLIKDEVLNVRVGGADFCNIYGVRRKINESIWDIRVVANCLTDIINVFGIDYVVSGAVWEYFDGKKVEDKEISSNLNCFVDIDYDWAIGLRKELQLDRLNGMIGKTCIHPKQLKLVHDSLIVDNESYIDALQILNASVMECGVVKGQGHGKMNELRTHINWAKKIVALANIYGVKEDL